MLLSSWKIEILLMQVLINFQLILFKNSIHRGCGADEYYSCCLRCKKCQKGCKNTKHVSTS